MRGESGIGGDGDQFPMRGNYTETQGGLCPKDTGQPMGMSRLSSCQGRLRGRDEMMESDELFMKMTALGNLSHWAGCAAARLRK